MPVELPGEGLVTKGLADLGAEIESIEPCSSQSALRA